MNIKSIVNNLIITLFFIVLFQSPISNIAPKKIGVIVSGIDEIITVLILILMIICIIKNGIQKRKSKLLIYLIVFLFIGTISTMVYTIQNTVAILEDCLNSLKFLICIIGLNISVKYYNSSSVIQKIQRISIYLIKILFLLTIIDIILPGKLFEETSFRYGFHSVKLFFYHPAVFAQVVVALLSIITLDTNIKINSKTRIILKIKCLIMICMTLRSKAFGFACIYLIICGYKRLNTKKTRPILLALMLITVISLSGGSIDKYYGNEKSARKTLTVDSIKIANNSFPIGLGYATFASASAAKYYSPIYSLLGYESIYGLGRITTSYATDTFWPILLGQFGYSGIILYVFILIEIAKLNFYCLKKNNSNGMAVWSILIYLLICSTSGTAFFNPIAIPYAIILVLGWNNNQTNILDNNIIVNMYK